ncbi:hypothetical protein BH10BAC3_BH10BAC3_15630 [soil metagenome]
MRKITRFSCQLFTLSVVMILFSAFDKNKDSNKQPYKFPYRQVGLTQRQAAAHVLSRFTYGAMPGQVDEVLKMGLENWFQQQLSADQSNDFLNEMLSGYNALSMSNQEIVTHYADAGQLVKMAVEEGVLTKEEVAALKQSDKSEYRQKLRAYMATKGLKPKAELIRQLINQKILRAAYSKNQFQEMLTGFWFNHFNISIQKNESSRFVLAYERDVIRPNVLGKFDDLLLATATSPAMLTYLDNNKSMVAEDQETTTQQKQQQRRMTFLENAEQADTSMQQLVGKLKKARGTQGLNENYAREIMELQTLGVDGGYTQNDVTEGARILTGWMVYPMDGVGRKAAEKITNRLGEDELKRLGYVHNGDFLFAAKRHDFRTKHFLGADYPAGVGYEEGLKLMHTLSHHPSTANFICKKLAVRFVNDDPPATLVKKMADTFLKEDGDIKSVLITMVSAPEFWAKETLREKIKSPFELVVSTVRATNASVKAPYMLYNWIEKMGEQLYAYQAPTGFPDRAKYWINSGALLYRMNFGLAFATGKIKGVSYDAAQLTNNHEPESPEAALKIYGTVLIPERNLEETQKRLLPLLKDPQIENKVNAAAEKMPLIATDSSTETGLEDALSDGKIKPSASKEAETKMQPMAITPAALMQIIGILIGSPEFQRR